MVINIKSLLIYKQLPSLPSYLCDAHKPVPFHWVICTNFNAQEMTQFFTPIDRAIGERVSAHRSRSPTFILAATQFDA